jgi:hypothetical protein
MTTNREIAQLASRTKPTLALLLFTPAPAKLIA